jgi:hypothetical protein
MQPSILYNTPTIHNTPTPTIHNTPTPTIHNTPTPTIHNTPTPTIHNTPTYTGCNTSKKLDKIPPPIPSTVQNSEYSSCKINNLCNHQPYIYMYDQPNNNNRCPSNLPNVRSINKWYCSA